jgi:hypothetical protein
MSQLNDVSRVRTERRQVCDSIGRLVTGTDCISPGYVRIDGGWSAQ